MPDFTDTTNSDSVTDRFTTAYGESRRASLAADTAGAARPADPKAEAICQAATLANWEGEGGTTVFAK